MQPVVTVMWPGLWCGRGTQSALRLAWVGQLGRLARVGRVTGRATGRPERGKHGPGQAVFLRLSPAVKFPQEFRRSSFCYSAISISARDREDGAMARNQYGGPSLEVGSLVEGVVGENYELQPTANGWIPVVTPVRLDDGSLIEVRHSQGSPELNTLQALEPQPGDRVLVGYLGKNRRGYDQLAVFGLVPGVAAE